MGFAHFTLLVVLNVQHSRDVILGELVVRIRDQQAGLSDGTITHNYQFDTNGRHFLCSTSQAAKLGHLNTFSSTPTILFVHVPRKKVQLKLTASRFFQSRNLQLRSEKWLETFERFLPLALLFRFCSHSHHISYIFYTFFLNMHTNSDTLSTALSQAETNPIWGMQEYLLSERIEVLVCEWD